jgi:hypothetical protein
MYNDKVTVYTVRQVLFLVVESRNTKLGHVLHTEEMRRDVQSSAHVTKTEIERPLGRPMHKFKEYIDIRLCPNESCTTMSIIVQQDVTIHSFIIFSADSSTCFI